jgi:hypothetical protein
MFALLQEGPAQTANYMVSGYFVIFGVLAFYVASLFMRQRNLVRDLEILQELQEKGT